MKERNKEFLTRLVILLVFELFCTTGGMANDLTLMISPQNGAGVNSWSTTVYNGMLYFAGSTEATGTELYRYDGINPPQLVADLQPNYGESSFPGCFTLFNNLLVFCTQNGIYTYDGQNPPILLSTQYPYQTPVEFNGKLYFTADVWPYGVELWSFDGVNPATLVQDIAPGYDSSYPESFCIYNNKLYFAAAKPTTGMEIYSYDGINPVQLVVDVIPGTMGSYPSKLKIFNGQLYFWLYDWNLPERNHQLWRYDFINPPSQVANVSHHNDYSNSDLVVFNNRLYFFCDDYFHGLELWSYDGTNAPAMVYDCYHGTNIRENSPFLIFGGKLYFAVHDGSMVQLWNCDTTNTVSLVAERLPADQSENYMRALFEFNGELYFSTPPELWKYTPSSFSVLSPNGHEKWYVGANQTITWAAPASITQVNIDYSVDDGLTWTPLAGPVPNTGAYALTVPNTPSTTCRVKASETNGTAFDISNAPFTIAQPLVITITSPNGGENLLPGGETSISWTAANHDGTELVSFQYSLDAGSSWTPIDHMPPFGIDFGSALWVLPNVQSTTCLVRINETTGLASDQSDAFFRIENSRYLMITQPQEHVWMEGTPQTIQWQWGGLISTVKIEYSTDGELTWNTIIASTPNTGTYNWTVPDIPNNPSRQCKIKITDLETSIYSDGLFFSIIGTEDRIPLAEREALIALYNATGGDNWTEYNGCWRNPANPSEFNIHGSEGNWGGVVLSQDFKHVTQLYMYNRNMSGDISDLSAFTALTSLDLSWNQLTGPIPDLSASTGLKTLNLYKNNLTGTLPPTLGNLTQLEDLLLSQNSLSGNIPANIGNLLLLKSLRLDKNKLTGSIPDTLMNLTSLYSYGIDFVWNGLYTSNTTLRDFIFNHHNGPRDWESNQTLAPVGLAVSNIQGNTAQISWQAVPLQSIAGGYVMYRSTTSGSNYQPLTTINDKAQTTYTATELEEATVYYYAIKTFSNPHTNNINRVTSEFSEPLTVMAGEPKSITVTSPNGGESWEGLTLQTITWTHTGTIANVKIEYTINNGTSWTLIHSSTPNTGTFPWTVTTTPGTQCLIRVSETSGTTSDTSNAVFTITPRRTLTITAPNGGQQWYIGSTYAITWTSTGPITNVKIEYSLDSGYTWNIIVASAANSGTYNWLVPSISPSIDALIRITDSAGLALDISNTVFTIALPTLTVTAPNGGESWKRNTYKTITWTTAGTIPTVKLQYSINGGTSWTTITNSWTNTGTYQWLVPNVSSTKTTCKIKIMANGVSAQDTSNGNFTILK